MFEYTFVLWLAKRTKRETKGKLRLVAQRLFSCFLIQAMHARLCIAWDTTLLRNVSRQPRPSLCCSTCSESKLR